MEPITAFVTEVDDCILHVSTESVFQKTVHQHIGHAMFSDTNISQGSVATPLKCGGICNDLFVANFLLNVK